MSTVTIHIDGLDKLNKALLAFPVSLAKRTLNHATSEGAKVIEDEAVNRAPVASGRVSEGQPPPGSLKKAIRRGYLHKESNLNHSVFHVYVWAGKSRQAVHTRKRVKGVVQVINLDVFYAYFVEYGSIHNHTPARYMRGAWEAKGTAAALRIRDVLAEGVSGAVAEARG